MKGNASVAMHGAGLRRWLHLATPVLVVAALTAGGSLLQGQNEEVAVSTKKPQSSFDALLATPDRRRQYIEQMSAAEKERLRRQAERFAELDAAEKRRLRRLQQDLAAAADQEELVAVMRSYQTWVSALTPSRRAEFLDLPPDKRIANIQRINAEKRRHASDMEALAGWIERRMIDHAPPEMKRRWSRLDSSQRRRRMAEMWLQQRKQDRRSPLLRINEEGFEELGELLSDEARRELENRALQQKRELLARWINRFAQHYTGNITPQEIRRLIRDLPEEKREKFHREISTLSPEEVRRKLKALYLELNPYGRRDFPRDRPPQRRRPTARDTPRPARDSQPVKQ